MLLGSLQHERAGVQPGNQDQQRPVASHQRRILEDAANHGAEQVGREGKVRGRDVAEAPRKHEIGEENRSEGNHDRDHEARNNR